MVVGLVLAGQVRDALGFLDVGHVCFGARHPGGRDNKALKLFFNHVTLSTVLDCTEKMRVDRLSFDMRYEAEPETQNVTSFFISCCRARGTESLILGGALVEGTANYSRGSNYRMKSFSQSRKCFRTPSKLAGLIFLYLS